MLVAFAGTWALLSTAAIALPAFAQDATGEVSPSRAPDPREALARLRAAGVSAAFDGQRLSVRAERPVAITHDALAVASIGDEYPSDGSAESTAPLASASFDADFALEAMEVAGLVHPLARDLARFTQADGNARLPVAAFVEERFDERPGGVEQSFWIERPLGAGAIVVRVDVLTSSSRDSASKSSPRSSRSTISVFRCEVQRPRSGFAFLVMDTSLYSRSWVSRRTPVQKNRAPHQGLPIA